MVYIIDKESEFPDPYGGDEDGLFAIGADLSPNRLFEAYSRGSLPWYPYKAEDCHESLIDPETKKPYIQWWCPMQRFVIFPKEIQISHSMRQEINKVKKGELSISINKAFDKVLDYCGSMSCGENREILSGAWLGEDIKTAYTTLHEMGFAMSVEIWDKEDNLIGGLYGVELNNGFFGESMFSLKPNASKLALIFLAFFLAERNIGLIDCQLETAHLKSMGGRMIPYEEYLEIINRPPQETAE